jgi:hypothetical protein
MKVGLFKDIVESSDIGYWQVLMSELDSSLNRMRYISLSDLKDAYEIQQFNQFWDDVKDEVVVVSISDNADLYELSDDLILIVLIETLDNKIFVFDVQDAKKIENKILSY